MKRDEIVEIARSWIGTPYHHQAAVKGAGCDRLGLACGVYQSSATIGRGTPREAAISK